MKEDVEYLDDKELKPGIKTYLVILAVISGILLLIAAAVYIGMNNPGVLPIGNPPTPTPMPTPLPTVTVQPLSTPTPTPLPKGVEYALYAGPYGPQKVMVFNLTKDTPATYDPGIGMKCDAINLVYGYMNNSYLIPAIVRDSKMVTHQGYYSTADGMFHYAFGVPTTYNQFTVINSSEVEQAKMLNNYALGDTFIVNGKLYSYDSTGNIVRLSDGKIVSEKVLYEYPSNSGSLNMNWDCYTGSSAPPNSGTGYTIINGSAPYM